MTQALRTFEENRDEYCLDEISIIVIVTNSDYAFKGITSHVGKWMTNGYMNCKGGPVVNGDEFFQLNSAVEDLESDGVDVLFWRVSREFNQEADELARSEL